MNKQSMSCSLFCLAFSGCVAAEPSLDTADPDADTAEHVSSQLQILACPPPYDTPHNDVPVWHGADIFGFSQNVLRGVRDCGGQRVGRNVTKVFGTGSCSIAENGNIVWANELCARDPNMWFGNAQITQACQEFSNGGSSLGDHDCRYIAHVGGAPYTPPFQPSNDTMCQPSYVVRTTPNCPPPTGQIYVSTTGFSSTQGANQWSYLDGNGVAMVYDNTYANGAWHSTTPANGDWCYISRTQQHPGNNTSTMDSIRRWTAPNSGLVSIIGNSKMSGTNGGDGAYVMVRKNGIQLFRGLVAASDITVGQRWSLTARVTAGDTIDTVVNRGGTYNNDEQLLTQTIAYPLTAGSFNFTGTNTNSAQWNTTTQPIVLGINQTLTVGTCGVAGSSFSGDTYLRLYNSGGTQVAGSDDACTGLGSRFVHTAVSDENFTLHAGCYANGSCAGTVAWNIQ